MLRNYIVRICAEFNSSFLGSIYIIIINPMLAKNKYIFLSARLVTYAQLQLCKIKKKLSRIKVVLESNVARG